jgi:hypothetical protein
MKFKRMERFERAAWTQRGLAMATSKPARLAKKLQEKYPLISDQLPAPKPFDADAELSRRQSLLDSTERGSARMKLAAGAKLGEISSALLLISRKPFVAPGRAGEPADGFLLRLCGGRSHRRI